MPSRKSLHVLQLNVGEEKQGYNTNAMNINTYSNQNYIPFHGYMIITKAIEICMYGDEELDFYLFPVKTGFRFETFAF
ncbi:UNVERIFIED_CONTAM: hypothetical protein NCL1_30665 [Trichonephila clavipes]